MDGLIIKKKWLDLILDGKKTWEIRGNNTNKRGRVVLIESGTGLVVGEVRIINSSFIDNIDFELLRHRHQIHDMSYIDLLNIYSNPHKWELWGAKKYDKPIPYKHKQGAVIWVKDCIKEEVSI